MKKQKRQLHPDIYDALEFSALVFGGIGAGNWWKHSDSYSCRVPYCGRGHAMACDTESGNTCLSALSAIEVYPGDNDRAVIAINTRKARSDLFGRVTFKEWAKELGIVRAVVHEGSEVVNLGMFGMTNA